MEGNSRKRLGDSPDRTVEMVAVVSPLESGDMAAIAMCQITKDFDPFSTEGAESLLLKDSSVECVHIVDKILDMFEG